MRKLVFFFGVFSLVIVFAGSARAQETQISVAPAIIDVPIEVGQSAMQAIWVTNGSQSALPVSIEVQGAVVEAEPLEDSPIDRFDVADWIRFDEETYLFEPGQTRKITFMITAPFNALPGGHYAHISLRGLALQRAQSEQAASLVFPEIGVPMLITVPGQVIEDARVSDGSVFPRFATPGSDIETSFYIENTGTIHNIVSPSIIIEKAGEIVEEVRLQPLVLLPGTRKQVSQVWRLSEYGSHTARIKLSFGNKNQIELSSRQQIVSTPSFARLFWLAVIVWSLLYMLPRRRNIIAAVRTLFASD